MTSRNGSSTLVLAAGSLMLALSGCSNQPAPAQESVSSANPLPTDGSASSAGPGTYNPCAEPVAAWSGDAASDGNRFEPPGLSNVALSPNAALKVYASTLESGPSGPALYVGICNQSGLYQCSPAIQVELYDESRLVIGTVSNAVQSGRVFDVSESPYPISCVAPGEVGMAALTEFPDGVTFENIKALGHRFSVFQFESATPLAAARVNDVEPVAVAGGTAFRGVVVNTSDSILANPVASVFPVNDAARPLGSGAAGASIEIPPGATWSFETSAVAQRGVAQVAFAAAGFKVAP